MAKVILGMTTSLDGFVADQNGRAGRVYSDLATLRDTAYMNDVIEETGAVLMGKRTFEMGEKAVQVAGGASVAQQLLDAALVDELRVDIMPVFLGTGRRFFDNASLERVRLEKIDAREIGARTCLRYRVK